METPQKLSINLDDYQKVYERAYNISARVEDSPKAKDFIEEVKDYILIMYS